MQKSLCRECDHPLEPHAEQCAHCGSRNPDFQSEVKVCWICGSPALKEPDMESRFACSTHFVQACWVCLQPVRRSDAWKLSTKRAVYYFHHPECYLRGKKKIRRLRTMIGTETIICDPRDPVGNFSTSAGCLGPALISFVLLVTLIGAAVAAVIK